MRSTKNEPLVGAGEQRAAELRVDRAMFLLLASALAAGGCVVTNEESGSGAGGATSSGGSGAQAGGATGAGGSSSAGQDGGPPGAGGTSGGDSSVPPGMGGSSGSPNTGGSSGNAGSGGAPPDGGACLGDEGAAVFCDPTLEGGVCVWHADYCAISDGLKVEVAEAVSSCMEGNVGCSTSEAYDCLWAALTQACPDPTADDFCSTIESPLCHENDCPIIVSGLNANGRARVLACVANAEASPECYESVWPCLEGI